MSDHTAERYRDELAKYGAKKRAKVCVCVPSMDKQRGMHDRERYELRRFLEGSAE